MATLAARSGRPLLEREDELTHVAAALRRAASGQGSALVVHGPAGIGKTRLVQAALEEARDQGIRSLTARCDELDRASAFGVVHQLFAPAMALLPDEERRRLERGVAGVAGRLLRGEDLGPDPGTAAIHGLFWLTAGLAEDRPLVLAVDDAHWADHASLRFLGHLLKGASDIGVALVLSLRTGEPGADDPLVARIVDDPLTVAVRPAKLSPAGVRRMLETALGADPDAAVLEACRDLSDGNPFLVRELARSLAQGGGPDAAELLQKSAPRGVRRSVASRLARLPPSAAELARAVAVLGAEVEPRLAAALAGLDGAAASAAADALRAAGILGDRLQLAFVHPLVRTAVVDALTVSDRARRHLEAAQLLRREEEPLERIAAQLLQAEPSGLRWAAEALRAAAARSRAQGAPESAATYLRRALAEPPARSARSEVLLELGEAAALAGHEDAAEHLREALRLGPGPVRRRAALALGRTLGYLGRLSEAVSVFEDAADAVARQAPEAAPALEGALLGAGMLDVRTAARVEGRGRRLAAWARSRDDVPANVLGVLAMRAVLVGAPAGEAARLGERALGLPTGEPEPDEAPWRAALAGGSIGTAAFHAAAALVFAGRSAPAGRFLDDAVAELARRGAVQAYSAASCFRALLALRLGDLAGAEADAQASLDAGRTHGLPLFVPLALGVLVEVLVRRGEQERAAASLLDAGPAAADDTSLHGAILLHARGLLRLSERRPAEARDDLLEVGRRLGALRAPNPALAGWRSAASKALVALGEREQARRLAADEVRLARAFGAPGPLGAALRRAARLEDGGRCLAALGESVAVLEGTDARLERAASLVELGAALRRSGRRADARRPLAAGLDAAHRCGAVPLAERARTEMRAAGARPRRPVLSGKEALTASEARVAAMAAEGLSNREIAQALFVSTRTVETHLTHAYAKLRVASRTGLAAALA